MFQYQVEDMRATIKRLIERPRPPLKVGIKLAHAVYLRLDYQYAPPIDGVRIADVMEVSRQLYGSIVMVDLLDLFQALKEAQGVDYEIQVEKRKRYEDKRREAEGIIRPTPRRVRVPSPDPLSGLSPEREIEASSDRTGREEDSDPDHDGKLEAG